MVENVALVSTEGYPTFDSKPDLHFGGMRDLYAENDYLLIFRSIYGDRDSKLCYVI